ncbi:MAG TPA: hypothetical protein VFC38_04745 [Stellaceae bacterium]|nr:hypothetical protein [Stellaceae bacterium]
MTAAIPASVGARDTRPFAIAFNLAAAPTQDQAAVPGPWRTFTVERGGLGALIEDGRFNAMLLALAPVVVIFEDALDANAILDALAAARRRRMN